MEQQFAAMRKTRGFLLSLLEGLSVEQLNKIPEGFNNNIVWNFGHVIAAQEGICYRRSGLSLSAEQDAFYERFKPGSKPESFVEETEIEGLKVRILSSVDDLENDYKAGRFPTYNAWTTRYGIAIQSIEEAISFLTFHDGLHIGYIMALRHCV